MWKGVWLADRAYGAVRTRMGLAVRVLAADFEEFLGELWGRVWITALLGPRCVDRFSCRLERDSSEVFRSHDLFSKSVLSHRVCYGRVIKCVQQLCATENKDDQGVYCVPCAALLLDPDVLFGLRVAFELLVRNSLILKNSTWNEDWCVSTVRGTDCYATRAMFSCSLHRFSQLSRSNRHHRMTTCPINTTLPSFPTMAWPLFDSSNILSTNKRRERSALRAVAQHVPGTSSSCHAAENHAIDIAWLCCEIGSRHDVVVKLLSLNLSCQKLRPKSCR